MATVIILCRFRLRNVRIDRIDRLAVESIPEDVE